ncbi:hypothetical protein GOBAR_DD25974 [Gossypium barbadense]|nr:hypothetical protein GOBAR_DD25974 [Gossypium barbadense]
MVRFLSNVIRLKVGICCVRWPNTLHSLGFVSGISTICFLLMISGVCLIESASVGIVDHLRSCSEALQGWCRSAGSNFKQTVYWRQRSKVLWLSQGEANTRCFHARASKCRRVNQELFSASTSTDYLAFNDFAPSVGDGQYMALLAPFEAWEFKEAIMSMHPDKAAGPDGLNPAFFQRCWPIIRSDVYAQNSSWLERGEFLAKLNETIIVLIPKKNKPQFGRYTPSLSHMLFANEVELKEVKLREGYHVMDPVKAMEMVDENTICVAVILD